jgi:hypothetical protein
MELIEEIKTQFAKAEKAVTKLRDDPFCSWNEKEALFLGRNLEATASQTKSQVFDPRLQTQVIERSQRVMAQFPSGKVQALSKDDKGKNVLMNLVIKKYIEPNADSQFDLLTKLQLLDLYSLVYGSFACLVDWRVDDDYVGPDLWLIPIRSLFPQAGATTVDDCDYIFVSSFVSLGWLKKRNKETWKNIDKIVKKIGEGAGKTKNDLTTTRKSYVETLYGEPGLAEKGDYAQIELITRYERDRWTTFAPDFDVIVRDIPNPQKNNEIPIVVKHAFPLLDRFFGLGEMEKGKTLQYSINSLINLYLDGVRMSLFPPTIINPNGVIASTIEFKPLGKWLETTPNSIRTLPVSPVGINTFQSTYSFLLAAIANLGGTSDVTVPREADITQGKTPAAIKYMAARENTRDNFDRIMMERALDKIYNLFVDLLVNRQEKPINLDLFEGEIKQLQEAYPNEQIMEVFESGKFGRATVKKGVFANSKFRFYVEPGTTMKKDEAMENQNLISLIQLFFARPDILQLVQQEGIKINLGYLIKRFIITSGIQEWDKIVEEIKPEDMNPKIMGLQPNNQIPMPTQAGNQLQAEQGQTPDVEALINEIKSLAGGQQYGGQ